MNFRLDVRWIWNFWQDCIRCTEPYISSTLIPQIQICNFTRNSDILEANAPTVIHIEFGAGLETINLSLHV